MRSISETHADSKAPPARRSEDTASVQPMTASRYGQSAYALFDVRKTKLISDIGTKLIGKLSSIPARFYPKEREEKQRNHCGKNQDWKVPTLARELEKIFDLQLFIRRAFALKSVTLLNRQTVLKQLQII